MSTSMPIEVVRLAGAEIDDQAIMEITRLFRQGPHPNRVSPAWLIRLAAEGPLMVARRPCGEHPEIIAVAGWSPDLEHLETAREVVALDPEHAATDLADALRTALLAQPPSRSLFRGRDKAPLGLDTRRLPPIAAQSGLA